MLASVKYLDSLSIGDIWGKSKDLDGRYPLLGHLLDTSACVTALWETYLSNSVKSYLLRELSTEGFEDGDVLRLLRYAAVLHDVGKCCLGFQNRDEEVCVEFEKQGVNVLNKTSQNFHSHDSALIALRELYRLPPTDFNDAFSTRSRNKSNKLFSQILDGHHGVWSEQNHPISIGAAEEHLETRDDTANLTGQQAKIFEILSAHIWGKSGPRVPNTLKPHVVAIMTGIVILADWIASSDLVGIEQFRRTRNQPARQWESPGYLRNHELQALKQARKTLPEYGICRWAMEPKAYEERFGSTPRPLQQSLETGLVGKSGLLFISAPTGGGKTNAAWHAAHVMGSAAGSSGIFFGLPTMLTADGIYETVISQVGKTDDQPEKVVTRTHSMSQYNPLHFFGDSNSVEQRERSDWMTNNKRALIAPVSIGTVDQALAGAVRGKHVGLRLLGLSQKVVILDEAHAYSSYMHGVLSRLVEWLARTGTPMIVMSATLSQDVIDAISAAYLRGLPPTSETSSAEPKSPPDLSFDNPGWMLVCSDGEIVKSGAGSLDAVPVPDDERSELTIDLKISKPSDVERVLVSEVTRHLALKSDGNILVVCNTVARSQSVWLATQQAAELQQDDIDIQLLHSRFPRNQRLHIESDLRQKMGSEEKYWNENKGGIRPRRSVMIATQIVEQSLDIDFDLVVTDLAPMSLLIQRAGRSHRNKKRPKPAAFCSKRLVVVCPSSDSGKTLGYKIRGDKNLPDNIIYEEILLDRTFRYIKKHHSNGQTLLIPHGLKSAVDSVHGFGLHSGDASDNLRILENHTLATKDSAQQNKAQVSAIPSVNSVNHLSELSATNGEQYIQGTRGDIESASILPVWEIKGVFYLDAQGEIRLPSVRDEAAAPNTRRRPNRAAVKTVVDYTIPAYSRNRWVSEQIGHHSLFDGIYENPLISDLRQVPVLRDVCVVLFGKTRSSRFDDKIWHAERPGENVASLSSRRGLALP